MRMKTTAIILLALLLPAATALAVKLPPNPHAPGETGWRQDGRAVANAGNIKSSDGFGAQLWLIGDETFFENWNKPETPNLNTVSSAVRNKPIFAIILFINPGVNALSEADVTADIVIKKPDGSIYGEFKDVEIWQRSYPFSANAIQLAAGNISIEIEDADQLGTYSISAVVTDHVKNIALELHTDFTAKE